jgi:putative endopeptidase
MTFRSLIAVGASALALAVSAPALAEDAPASSPVAATPAPTPLPTMTFGTWGFDPAAIDKSIDPGDDFFAYANSKWLKANPLPPEFSRFGAFNLLA